MAWSLTQISDPAAFRKDRTLVRFIQSHTQGILMKHGHSSHRGRSQELLYDSEIPTPTHAERARTLVSAVKTATLCTLFEENGTPYGSFVTFALVKGRPVFLVSELADARASLLVAENGQGDPLANGRVTLVGRCTPVDEGDQAAAREAFLAVHPNASYYVDFKDFSFFQLEVEQIRYIGGYGRMSWVESPDWYSAQADPIAPFSKHILDHMNKDHTSAILAYCQAFSKAGEVPEATMTGIDRYGFEMSAKTEKGPRPIRVAFDAAIGDAKEARTQLVELAKRARAQTETPT
jgi:putative heme iron utilization protein